MNLSELLSNEELRQREFPVTREKVFLAHAGVWGVASVTTNVEGRVFVNSTNATTLVLRVRDADGKVESLKTP